MKYTDRIGGLFKWLVWINWIHGHNHERIRQDSKPAEFIGEFDRFREVIKPLWRHGLADHSQVATGILARNRFLPWWIAYCFDLEHAFDQYNLRPPAQTAQTSNIWSHGVGCNILITFYNGCYLYDSPLYAPVMGFVCMSSSSVMLDYQHLGFWRDTHVFKFYRRSSIGHYLNVYLCFIKHIPCKYLPEKGFKWAIHSAYLSYRCNCWQWWLGTCFKE